MHFKHRKKGASDSGAPFFWRLLLAGLLAGSVATAAADDACKAGQISERIRVHHVYDGDTVKLEDGRRLRFIGINAPETAHHGQVKQPYANRARNRVRHLLAAHGNILLLQPGRERTDRYGRQLAHVYLENGQSVAVRLLQEGLATTLAVPPNVSHHDCYQRHEDQARRAGRGLWSLEAYAARPTRTLSLQRRGFSIIRGKVLAVRNLRHSIQLNLEGPLQLHIDKKDSANFRPGFLQTLEGRYIESRGWIRPRGKGLQMKVRHPAALAAIQAPANTHRYPR